MTFKEAAEEILRRAGRPLHYKELAQLAAERKLLTFVGRTPELTMQSQLTDAVKKAPGRPFVRVKTGVFGLLRYPELPPEEKQEEQPVKKAAASAEKPAAAPPAPRGERRRAPQTAETEDAAPGRRRRRRGGSGRLRPDAAATTAPISASETDVGESEVEPPSADISPEARAAALAETGVLDVQGDEGEEDNQGAFGSGDSSQPNEPVHVSKDDAGAGEMTKADEEADDHGGKAESADGAAGAAGEEVGPGRRRRRRRRRGAKDGPNGIPAPVGGSPVALPPAPLPYDSVGAFETGAAPVIATPAVPNGGAAAPAVATPNADGTELAGRKIMTPIDAAIEVLKGQAPGRGIHVRQIADSAVRRRLVHGEPNEAWRVIRTALATEPKERLRAGLRPRVRAAGSGLFALARRSTDLEIERAEQVFGEARRALRERTLLALERRIAELPPAAFEALARVLIQREGFGPATFVKRVEGTIYVESLRGRGSRPSRCLVALRAGATTAGRRAIGELRAGIRARNQEEGLLMLAGRLADDAIAEWKLAGFPVEIADGPALAETCIRHGVGVIGATINVDFVDADFFAELTEG